MVRRLGVVHDREGEAWGRHDDGGRLDKSDEDGRKCKLMPREGVASMWEERLMVLQTQSATPARLYLVAGSIPAMRFIFASVSGLLPAMKIRIRNNWITCP